MVCLTAAAQEKRTPTETTPVVASNELTIDAIQARLKKLDDNKELEPALKTKLNDSYAKTLDQLRAAADFTARIDQFAKLTRDAPEMLHAVKDDLAKPRNDSPRQVAPNTTLVQAQQLLTQAENEFSEAQKALQTLQDEPKRRANRRVEVPKLADAAKLQLQEIEKQLDSKPDPDEPVELTTATRLFLEARKKAITAETAANQAELQMFEATGELLASQRDRAAQHLAETEANVKSLRAVVNERRRHEAEMQALQARRTSIQADPVVKRIAEVNADLARHRQLLATKIEETSRELEDVTHQSGSLEERFKNITKRYDMAGGTTSIGLMLRKQRSELPDAGDHLRKIKKRTSEIADTNLQAIDYEEKRNGLATLDQRVKTIMQGLNPTLPHDDHETYREFLEEEVRSVLEAQRTLYDSLIADTNNLLDKLVELDVQERQLVSRTRDLAKYCDERILWIRSTTPLDLNHARQIGPALGWLLNPSGWRAVGVALASEAERQPALTAAMTMIFLTLLLLQHRLRRTIAKLGEQAARSNNISYLPTIRAFLITGLMASLWPGLMGYVGQRLVVSEKGLDFPGTIGHGLMATALIFGTLEILRQVCRPHGLGESHFGWDTTSLRVFRVALWWFVVCGVPWLWVVTTCESQPSEVIKNSLGRTAFVISLLVLSGCIHLVLRPAGGAFDRQYAVAPQAWGTKLQTTWHWCGMGLPVTIAGFALVGYYYTALQLSGRLLGSCWLVMGLWIVYAALIRWTLLSYRDLAMRKAREKRAEKEAAAPTPGTSTPPASVVFKPQPEVKLSDINKQTRKALQLVLAVGLFVGLWFVWIGILPALGALRHVNLWMVEATTTVGATATTVLVPVTLANVLLALILIALTVAGSRNVPSLLQMTLLQRLPIDPGVRYAITAVCQYAITAVGLICAFGTIGVGWSKVQWLVAAISVGLGFGLQEIFANFVSGLILLVERPVRLGDIVTVDNVTGHVTRIQMRATTITDWEMRDLVVPNKEFITSKVMNWTLSSTVARMSITVGAAYDSDPELVRNLLLQVATRNSMVLKDPPPHALFDSIGESTLNFILRVYMPSLDVFLDVRHNLHTEIIKEFQRAGINIAFPQRDIHIFTHPASESLYGRPADAQVHGATRPTPPDSKTDRPT